MKRPALLLAAILSPALLFSTSALHAQCWGGSAGGSGGAGIGGPSGRSGGGGTTGGGGGGVAGQSPFVPGESTLLPWREGGTLHGALRREQGAIQPVLIYLYSSSMGKDCCAANFERTLFRYESTVEAFQEWACYKIELSSAGVSETDLARFDLRKDKPALILLDADGGLIHKQQLCVDPKKFLRVIESAKRLSDLRFRLKDRYLAKRREAREFIEEQSFDRALRILDDILSDRDKLTGHVLTLVEEDRSGLASVARERLAEASRLRDDNQLLESYRLFEEVEKEFARLEDLGREAEECRKEVGRELRKMGVRVR